MVGVREEGGRAMMVCVTSSVMIPMTVAKVKVPTSQSRFIRLLVHALTSPITVTPAPAHAHAAHQVTIKSSCCSGEAKRLRPSLLCQLASMQSKGR